MIQTINFNEFRQSFHNMGRGEQFSHEALELIFDYLEECDSNSELDVIAICCDFSEGDFQEIANELDDDEDELTEECYGLDAQETAQLIADKLGDKTCVLGVTSNCSIVFQQF
jgi:hypothetical protein